MYRRESLVSFLHKHDVVWEALPINQLVCNKRYRASFLPVKSSTVDLVNLRSLGYSGRLRQAPDVLYVICKYAKILQ